MAKLGYKGTLAEYPLPPELPNPFPDKAPPVARHRPSVNPFLDDCPPTPVPPRNPNPFIENAPDPVRNSTQLQRALSFARQDIAVFPCRPHEETNPQTGEVFKAKTPRTPNGFYGAKTNEAAIRRWWSERPDDLVGVPTGAMNGFNAVDLDRKGGKDGFASIAVACPDLPETFKWATPNDGEHRLFRHPDGRKIASRTDVFKALTGSETGIDIRGDGGYVIAYKDAPEAFLERLAKWPAELDDAFAREEQTKAAQRNADAVRTDRSPSASPPLTPSQRAQNTGGANTINRSSMGGRRIWQTQRKAAAAQQSTTRPHTSENGCVTGI